MTAQVERIGQVLISQFPIEPWQIGFRNAMKNAFAELVHLSNPGLRIVLRVDYEPQEVEYPAIIVYSRFISARMDSGHHGTLVLQVPRNRSRPGLLPLSDKDKEDLRDRGWMKPGKASSYWRNFLDVPRRPGRPATAASVDQFIRASESAAYTDPERLATCELWSVTEVLQNLLDPRGLEQPLSRSAVDIAEIGEQLFEWAPG
jgi:hypothetical protein